MTDSERVISLFRPDMLLGEQDFARMSSTRLAEPARKLTLADLSDAIYCFQDHCLAQDGNQRRLFEDTRRWIFEAKDDCNFSFDGICIALELDPGYIRKGVLRWWEKELSKHPSRAREKETRPTA